MADWWEAAPLAQPAPASDPSFTGFIPGTPKPTKPDIPTLPAGYRWGPGGPGTTMVKIPGGPADKGEGEDDPQKAALKDAIAGLGLEELLTGVKRARTKIEGGRATGLTGMVLGAFPGTDAATVWSEGGLADQLQGGIIAEKLQALKEASKTGASGMGALSEREGARLAASVAAIGPKLDDATLKASLDDIERHAKTLQAVRDGLDPRDPAVQKKYNIPKLDEDIWGPSAAAPPPPGETTPRGPGDKPPELEEMNTDQKTAYAAFWKANPNPTADKLSAFMDSIGIPGVEKNAAENIIKGVREGAGYSTAIDKELVLRAELAKQQATGIGPLSDNPAESMITSGATLGIADEAAGLGRGISYALQGKDPAAGYRLGRDAQKLRQADIRKQMGYGATALEVGGGFLSANPASVLAPFAGVTDMAVQGGKAGLYGGALAGWGQGEGLSDSATGAVVGGAAGSALGAAFPVLASRIMGPAADPALARAAADESVRVPRGLVTGSKRDINRLGVLEADTNAAPIIQKGLENTAEDISAGVQRLGQGGTAQDRQAAGELVRQAAKDIKEADRVAANAAYTAAEAIQPDAKINPVNMRAKLDAEIARLQRTPGTNEEAIKVLQRYRRDLDQPIALADLREMRSSIRDGMNAGDLTRSSGQKRADRRMLSILEGTKDDIKAGLSPEAFKAWSEADAMYSGQMRYVKEALRPFVGKDFDQLSGEQIFDRIRTAANSNGKALAALHRRLPPDQSRDIAATFAESLGRRSPEENFSAALFMQQARKLSPSARETIFGPSGARSFDNLLRLSRGLERFKSQINVSKTARPVRNAIRQKANLLVTSLLGGGGYAAGGPMGGAAGVAVGGALALGGGMRNALSARALMNPRVTRWLEQAANTNTPRQAEEAVQRLGVVMSREPALVGELQPLHDFLRQAITRPAAASGTDQGDGGNESQ